MQEPPVNVDSKFLTKITIHHCCKLKLSHLLTQPVVFLYVVDSKDGSYVKKQDKNKAAVSFYETQRGDVDYIMPIMTRPCFVQGDKSQILKWEESFILNENLDYLIKKESSTILFFEVVDLAPTSITKDNYERLNENHIQKLAWAFLKLVGSNEIINIGNNLRLQLYKPHASQSKKNSLEVDAFRWWSKCLRNPLQASIYISVESHEIFSVEPALRSMLPLQEETTLAASEKPSEKNDLSSPLHNSNNSAHSQNKNTVLWSRKKGESCKVPNLNALSLSTGNSSEILKFSTSGLFLVIGGGNSNQYFISFYEIPSGKLLLKKLAHSDVIYDFDWSIEDSYLLSASGDYTVKMWCSESWAFTTSFVHPSFVYAAKFQPSSKNILCTACYDHVIRIWTYNKTALLLQELEAHNAPVNTLCWLKNKTKLISGDSNGRLYVWRIPYYPKHSLHSERHEKYCLEKLLDVQEIKAISIEKFIGIGPDDVLFLLCSDNSVRMVNYESEEIVFLCKNSAKFQNSLTGCCSPCLNLFFLSNSDGSITVWDVKRRTIQSTMPNTLESCQLSCIDYHPFDHMIATSSVDESVPVRIYTYCQQGVMADSLKEVHSSDSLNTSKPNSTSCQADTSKKLVEESKSFKSHGDPNDLPVWPTMHKLDKKKTKESKKYSSDLYSIDHKSGHNFYESDSSTSQSPFENFAKREKSETLTAIITKSGEFDLIAVTDSSTKSDVNPSTSDQSSTMQRSSKRSQRRRKLKELRKS